jgi:hypothetical protein
MSAPARPPDGRLQARTDVLAGLLFAALAAIGLWISRDYPVGTATRMGTGYVPRLLLWILLALGALIAGQGLRAGAGIRRAADEIPALRPIVFVTVGLIAFGLAVERLGLVVAIALLVGIAGGACPQLTWREVLLAIVGLVGVSLTIFVFGLGLALPVWPLR